MIQNLTRDRVLVGDLKHHQGRFLHESCSPPEFFRIKSWGPQLSGRRDPAVPMIWQWLALPGENPKKNAVFHTGLNHAVRQKWIWDFLNETFWGCISCGCLWFEKIYHVWFIAICGECIWRSQILNVLCIFTCIYHTKDLLDTRDFVIL